MQRAVLFYFHSMDVSPAPSINKMNKSKFNLCGFDSFRLMLWWQLKLGVRVCGFFFTLSQFGVANRRAVSDCWLRSFGTKFVSRISIFTAFHFVGRLVHFGEGKCFHLITVSVHSTIGNFHWLSLETIRIHLTKDHRESIEAFFEQFSYLMRNNRIATSLISQLTSTRFESMSFNISKKLFKVQYDWKWNRRNELITKEFFQP